MIGAGRRSGHGGLVTEALENDLHQQGFRLTNAQDRAMDMLVSDAVHCALGGGSRSGKTLLLVRAVLIRAIRFPGSRHAIFRFRMNHLKASIIYGTLPEAMKMCFPGLWDQCELNKTEWFLTLPNGSEIWFGGLDDKERTEKILGLEFATIYFNECSQIPYQSVTLARTRLAQKVPGMVNKCYYDFNPPAKSHWTYRMFVEKLDPESRNPLTSPERYGFYLINPEDNKENLGDDYLAELNQLPAKQRERFLLGKFADASEGALWTPEVLDAGRRTGGEDEFPEFLRIVVAVDPSGCRGEEDVRSDEVGVSVVALGTDSHGYVLEDLSGRHGPEGWSDIVNEAFSRHRADCVVGESNYGGDMVRAVLQAKNPDLPYREVNATRGKIVRAEPVSALYEQGKVHHVGHFPELEDQLCSFTVSGYMGLRSPDRADSAIWGLTELFPSLTRSKARDNEPPPQVKSGSRKASRFDFQKRRTR